MIPPDKPHLDITPEMVLRAYACGIFPMAESADDPTLHWIEPDERGVMPLDRFHVPSRLARTVRADRYRVTVDTAFDAVIAACAAATMERRDTWINARIRSLYGELHHRGYCHSVEVWDGETLTGGLYGVSLGAAFFGESMFHVGRDASKVALVHLVARLIAGEYRLLDAQFVTDHLAQFGATAVPRARYRAMLAEATAQRGDFAALPTTIAVPGRDVLAVLARR